MLLALALLSFGICSCFTKYNNNNRLVHAVSVKFSLFLPGCVDAHNCDLSLVL